MRKSIVLMLILCLTFLAGCIKIDINTGIDENFTAYLSYEIKMDPEDFDIRCTERLTNALNRIGWHYQEELGFNVELNIETNPYRLFMIKRIENENYTQAYNSLEYMLTNEEMTPFMMVDIAFNESERQNRYIFNASTDISKIISLSNAGDLSPALQEELENAIETGEGSITVSLPTSEIVNFSHRVDMLYHNAVMTAPLNYTGKTEMELAGVLNLLRDGSPGGSLNEVTQEISRLRNLSVTISCAVVVLLLIIILAKKLSGNRK